MIDLFVPCMFCEQTKTENGDQNSRKKKVLE